MQKIHCMFRHIPDSAIGPAHYTHGGGGGYINYRCTPRHTCQVTANDYSIFIIANSLHKFNSHIWLSHFGPNERNPDSP